MKKIACVILLFFSVQALAQVNSSSCVNPGFEDGTTNGWIFNNGDINGVSLPCNSCPATSGGIEWVTDMSGLSFGSTTCATVSQNTNSIDNYGGFPIVGSQGGNHALLLNNNCSGGKIQEANYSFVVNDSTSFFALKYALVLQSGGHPANEQPYFSLSVVDITTSSFVSTLNETPPSTGTIAGWSISTIDNTVYYKPWTEVVIDLSNASYLTHTIQVSVIVSDCNQGGHFGYAYIDGGCDSSFLPLANCNASTASAPICFVSSDSIPNNEVYFNHTISNFQGTIIYRQNALSTWDSIGYVPSPQPDYFIDITANPNQQSYVYATAQIDSCGNIRPKSATHKTILVQSSMGTAGQVNLSWNAYVGATVPYYYIYRGASYQNMSLLTQVSSSTYAYTDLNPLPGNNYYKVSFPVPVGCTSNANYRITSSFTDTLVNSNYSVFNMSTTGVVNIGNSLQTTIYPNPAKNVLFVKSPETGVKIEIIDLLGKTVLSQVSNSITEGVNIQSLSNGTYFVKITDSKGVYTKRFVVE